MNNARHTNTIGAMICEIHRVNLHTMLNNDSLPKFRT